MKNYELQKLIITIRSLQKTLNEHNTNIYFNLIGSPRRQVKYCKTGITENIWIDKTNRVL